MLQVVLTGLSTGAIYGLVGMGFAIVFYVTRVINFATGQLLMAAIMVTAACPWVIGPTVAADRSGPADLDDRWRSDLFPGRPPRPALQPIELRLAGQHAWCCHHPGVRGRLDLGHVIAVVPAIAQRKRRQHLRGCSDLGTDHYDRYRPWHGRRLRASPQEDPIREVGNGHLFGPRDGRRTRCQRHQLMP